MGIVKHGVVQQRQGTFIRALVAHDDASFTNASLNNREAFAIPPAMLTWRQAFATPRRSPYPILLVRSEERPDNIIQLSAVFFILSKQNYQVGRDSGPQFRLDARGSFKPDNSLMAKR